MGWYHYELANGRDPSNSDAPASCPDGTCSRAPDGAPGGAAESASQASEEEELYLVDGPVYHLCQKSNWMTCIRLNQAYFPPTFWKDGRFTRGCCVREKMIETANEYYKLVPGEWLLLELDSKILRQGGIAIACHRAPESTPNNPVECLKMYGGISVSTPGLVTKVFSMQRTSDGTYVGMQPDDATPKVSPLAVKAEKVDIPEAAPETAEEQKKEQKKGGFWKKKSKA